MSHRLFLGSGQSMRMAASGALRSRLLCPQWAHIGRFDYVWNGSKAVIGRAQTVTLGIWMITGADRNHVCDLICADIGYDRCGLL